MEQVSERVMTYTTVGSKKEMIDFTKDFNPTNILGYSENCKGEITIWYYNYKIIKEIVMDLN